MEGKVRTIDRLLGLGLILLFSRTFTCPAHAGSLTVTALAVSPAGSVSAGTAVTLTATVTSAGAIVHPRRAIFFNAAAAHCGDPAILRTAQLTPSEVATLRLRLGDLNRIRHLAVGLQ